MITIWKIAKAELQYLFYSPIAWIIFVILTVQVGLAYTNVFGYVTDFVFAGNPFGSITSFIQGDFSGFLLQAQNYLYFYIPLLTMGIMSRELDSGSINLLYSSPVKNSEIILGKYLALMIFSLSIVLLLGVYSIFSAATIQHVDIPLILSGLLGVFLLICSYMAIGLFMSSLSAYQIISAIGTFAILALMTYIRNIGQEFALVRDITYWLSMPGRSDNLINGLICSEDIIYFVAIITLFLSFAIVRLRGRREKKRWYETSVKFLGVFIAIALVGYISTRPKMMSYCDVTRTKSNTLSLSSQKVISKLKGGLTITTYINMLDEKYWLFTPDMIKSDINRFKQYQRFKPEIKLKYVYYYHKVNNPSLDKQYPGLNDEELINKLREDRKWKFKILSSEEVAKKVDLKPEQYRIVRLLERETGEKTFLRIFNDGALFPYETEITAAMKRLMMDKLPVIGFVMDHGERSLYDGSDQGYKMFAQDITLRFSLVNQGFNIRRVSLKNEVPSEVNILVIADPRTGLNEEEIGNLDKYVKRGDNLMIFGEPEHREFVNPIIEKFGVTLLPGTVVKMGRSLEESIQRTYNDEGEVTYDTIPAMMISPELMVESPVDTAWSFHLKYMEDLKYKFTSPTFSALSFDVAREFKVKPLFTCDSCWLEVEATNFIDDTVRLNPAAGEKINNHTLIAALSRDINGKNQRIIISGDADWISNRELGTQRQRIRTNNSFLINAAFFWLTHEEVPIDTRLPESIDKYLRIGKAGWVLAKPTITWGYPSLLLLVGLLIWIRRRGR